MYLSLYSFIVRKYERFCHSLLKKRISVKFTGEWSIKTLMEVMIENHSKSGLNQNSFICYSSTDVAAF